MGEAATPSCPHALPAPTSVTDMPGVRSMPKNTRPKSQAGSTGGATSAAQHSTCCGPAGAAPLLSAASPAPLLLGAALQALSSLSAITLLPLKSRMAASSGSPAKAERKASVAGSSRPPAPRGAGTEAVSGAASACVLATRNTGCQPARTCHVLQQRSKAQLEAACARAARTVCAVQETQRGQRQRVQLRLGLRHAAAHVHQGGPPVLHKLGQLLQAGITQHMHLHKRAWVAHAQGQKAAAARWRRQQLQLRCAWRFCPLAKPTSTASPRSASSPTGPWLSCSPSTTVSAGLPHRMARIRLI